MGRIFFKTFCIFVCPAQVRKGVPARAQGPPSQVQEQNGAHAVVQLDSPLMAYTQNVVASQDVVESACP